MHTPPVESVPSRPVVVAYALSGAAALTYQVVWYHAIVDLLGASATTFLVVLCSFIGGLGLGAIAARRVGAWLDAKTGEPGLPNYGRIELVMTLAALVLLLLTRLPLSALVGSFPYREVLSSDIRYFAPSFSYAFTRIFLTSLAVGLPCFLMGLTFPYLCGAYRDEPRFPSRLYAANTLGACLAVLLTEFLLLELIGYNGCLGLAAMTSLGISLWALRQPSTARTEEERAGTEGKTRDDTPSLLPGIVSGFLCGGLQALAFVLIKLTVQALRGSFALLSFLAIAGIFLASTGVHRFRPSRGALLAASWTGLGFTLLIWFAEPRVSEGLVDRAAGSSLSPFAAGLSSTFLVAAFQIFVPYALWSTLLPNLCDRLQERGIGLSRAYGLNTLAFLAGVLLFGWGLPYVNYFYSARVFGLVASALLIVLTAFSWERPLPRLAVVGLLASTGIGAWLLPRDLELRLLGGHAEKPQALAYRNTPQHLFWVTGSGSDRALMFDRISMSGVGLPSQRYMRQMAHLPLLLSERPQKALLICFGVGVTADAIRRHPTISRVDVVDLNPSVYLLNSWFTAGNGSVLTDPKLRLFADDGRQYLRLTQETYDFATMEPPPPLMPGIARLYSAEYYEDLKSRLSPGAVVSQWLPEYQIDQRGVDLITSTFLAAFQHAFLFVGSGRELILVGSDRPFDFGRVEKSLFSRPAVRADLRRIGFERPHQILATILRTTPSLLAEWANRPVIRDGFVSLEAIEVGMGQAIHPESPFWALKPNLYLDRADVASALAATAPGELAAVLALWNAPDSDLDYSRTVPVSYLHPR